MIRSSAKRGVEAALRWSGAALVGRALRRSDVLVLAYHNVVPDGARWRGDSSLHLTRSAFAAQLDHLARTHEVVPLTFLTSLGAAAAPRRRDRPRVVITFDDAYRGAVTIGVPELANRGMSATVFVAPAFIGDASFWWDCVSDPDSGEVAPDLREHALWELRGEDAEVRRWAGAQPLAMTDPPPFARAASEAELRAAAAAHPGLSFGSHTWSHPNLTTLAPEALRAEMERPLAWLRARFTNVVPWISYPFGLWSPEVARAAAGAGYDGGLRVDGGWVGGAPTTPFAVPRYNVPAGLSLAGFRLRTSGLFCR